MKESHARSYNELGAGEVQREVAEMFDSERGRELRVVHREPDLLPGFAAGDLDCGAVRKGVVTQDREGYVHGVSSVLSAFPPGRAAWPGP